MAKFKLEIDTGGSAFGDNPQHELSRILNEVVDHIDEAIVAAFVLKDINGNTVGKAHYSK